MTVGNISEGKIMKSAIEKIYFGKAQCERVKSSEDYSKFLSVFYEKYDYIKKILSEEQKPLFEEIIDLRGELEAESNTDAFKYGFKLGIAVGIETALD